MDELAYLGIANHKSHLQSTSKVREQLEWLIADFTLEDFNLFT